MSRAALDGEELDEVTGQITVHRHAVVPLDPAQYWERLEDVAELYRSSAVVMDIINFIRADANRPICQPKGGNAG